MERGGQEQPLVVAGVMSGTSADGVDVAFLRLWVEGDATRIEFLGHHESRYPRAVRAAVLAAMNAESISVREMARLHWRLGEIYGDAIVGAEHALGVTAQLAGVHGQTIYHQGTPEKYLNKALRCTWQIGEAAETALRSGLPVVSDFRPADMAAGGQGAPLVPMFDRVFFAHGTRNRILQNLGGMGNMTLLPAGSGKTLAFDTGPANAVIDICVKRLFGKSYDAGGSLASRGRADTARVAELLRHPYFAASAPKSCGREQFGPEFALELSRSMEADGSRPEDIVATATALTAESILQAYRTFAWPFLGQNAPMAEGTDYIVSGGGVKNRTLMRLLRAGLEPLGVEVTASGQFGMPEQAKEAAAFALLAWRRWFELPGNIPAATGASREALLGKISLPPLVVGERMDASPVRH